MRRTLSHVSPTARAWAVALVLVCALAGCTSAGPTKQTSASSGSTSAAPTSSAPASTPIPSSSNPRPSPSARTSTSTDHPRPTITLTHPSTHHPKSSTPRVTVPAGTGPVIVIDPGHSPTITHVDAATGLVDSDYANEPEMLDVYAVAQLVRSRLLADGYRVVMTKTSAYSRVSLGQRAAIANQVHAALALSIHDQAGSNGGIPFASGNNIVYYQAVGDYRATPSGKHITFTNSALAATSRRYGEIFQSQRSAAQGTSVRLQDNVGYNLGSRGLAAGNIWIVQLLSKSPWIYNESGGNSAGRSGLSSSDKQKYADGLAESVEKCVPVR